MTTFCGTGRLSSNKGVVQASVVVETLPVGQILHFADAAVSAYSPLFLSQSVHIGDPNDGENLPFSQS
jgi:hypothetical protein